MTKSTKFIITHITGDDRFDGKVFDSEDSAFDFLADMIELETDLDDMAFVDKIDQYTIMPL